MIRTFIAIKIEPGKDLIDLMNVCTKSLRNESIKWVEPENMHLTLKFLGDTSVEQVERVKEFLDKKISRFAVFNFIIHGLGYFKSNGQPRVIYSGIKDYQVLKDLNIEIGNEMLQLGFQKESREFNPHLTLGRIKSVKNKKSLFQLMEKYGNQKIQVVKVTEVIFYQSILKPQGPIYQPLKKVVLKGN